VGDLNDELLAAGRVVEMLFLAPSTIDSSHRAK